MRVPPQSVAVKFWNVKAVAAFIIALTIIAVVPSILSRVANAAPTVLGPNDIVIVTANSDSSWSTTACSDGAPGGPDSNAIDLLLRRDIGVGTEIKVTDKAWTGSALTSTEGSITYTAATDLPAGTVIRYSDCLYNMGGSGWTRSTPMAGFDTSVSGDTLLVYQGTDAAPSFIYGFGFRSHSWITSGTVTSNNSYVPAELLTASPAAYMSLGAATSSRNYQYTATGSYGIYSNSFLSDLKTAGNWDANGGTSAGTPFGPITMSFDVTRPTFSSVTRLSPTSAVTSATAVTFRVTASEAVQPLSSGDFTFATTGTITYSGVSVAAVSGSEYDITVTGLAGDGTIALASYTANLLDLQGNLATDTSLSSPAYTRDSSLTSGANAPTAGASDANGAATNQGIQAPHTGVGGTNDGYILVASIIFVSVLFMVAMSCIHYQREV